MDHKVVTANHKRANKLQQPNNNKTKKRVPLKVVYITNPIKFNSTASEFRALVQELTGQDSNVPPPSAMLEADDGGVEVSKVEVSTEGTVDGAEEEEGMKLEGRSGSDPLGSGSYDDHDEFCGVDSFRGLMDSSSFWNEGDDHNLYDDFKSQYMMDAM